MNLSDFHSFDELLVQGNPRLAPIHGACLSHNLQQRAMGMTTIIVHTYDGDVSIAHKEIEDHI